MSIAIQTPLDSLEIASFYDAALVSRLRDYINGNARIDAAVALATSAIRPATAKILDVGCGIGISAAELCRVRDGMMVHAVDISPKCIDAATRLFGRDGIEFEVDDMRAPPRLAPYDLIAMLDVYEHFPRDSWPGLHDVLGRSLSPDGVIVLTLPSPWHQEFLAKNDPGGLQVVDETVRIEDIATLARDVGGVVVEFQYVSIWRTNDYCHAVVARNPEYLPLSTHSLPSAGWAARLTRRLRVRTRLKARGR